MRTLVWLLAGLAVLGAVGLVAAQTLDTSTSSSRTSAPADVVAQHHAGHNCPHNGTADPADATSAAAA